MDDFLKHIDRTWTLFLDRDGVINKRLIDDYIKSWDEFVFLPGVKGSIKIFSEHFGRIIIVTNQQGVGRGLMTETSLKNIHRKMVDEITSSEGRIDAIYYCTDLKSRVPNCRKPSVTMFEKAKHDFPDIEASKCIMAGDSQSDMEFGKNAGMFSVFIGGDNNLTNVCYPDLKSFANVLNSQ